MDPARIDVHPRVSGDHAAAKASESTRYPVDADAFGPTIAREPNVIELASRTGR
jgi:hypothetical protein